MRQFPVYDIPDDDVNRWKRLPLGAGVSVLTAEILGIFDMDTATVSPVTKKFLNTAQKRGQVSVIGDELPKSFVVIAGKLQKKPGMKEKEPAETEVVLSQFSPSTLVGRDGGFN